MMSIMLVRNIQKQHQTLMNNILGGLGLSSIMCEKSIYRGLIAERFWLFFSLSSRLLVLPLFPAPGTCSVFVNGLH